MSRLDLLERVAMLALNVRKLELDLVSGQNAQEVRERLQRMRKALDISLSDLTKTEPATAYHDHPGTYQDTSQS